MRSHVVFALATMATAFLSAADVARSEWKPAANPLMTRWAADVKPEAPLPEYPRPQFVRDRWKNLNGLWNYAIRPASETAAPKDWDGEILVPFAVESALSGVKKTVPADHVLWYRRSVEIPADWKERVLLHFGAIDWRAKVWVGDQVVGEHVGGYDPFTVDITAALLKASAASNGGRTAQITVSVSDPTDGGYQPRGKQVRKPEGIWYTSVTGIWQTVWLEPVAETYLRGASIVPDFDSGSFRIDPEVGGSPKAGLRWTANAKGTAKTAQGASGASASISSTKLDAMTLAFAPNDTLRTAFAWSPANPLLVDIELQLFEGDRLVDTVKSYSALRKIELKADSEGTPRLFLNHQPLFQFGPLDQGWWPDGLYTAPTDDALKFDVEITKRYGFNMIRKHVKVEPARWYHWCDVLGMLVWQDMPSGDRHAEWAPHGEHDGKEFQRSPESAANFDREWKAIMTSLRNTPSIVMWVPYNEGWGQSETVRVTRETMAFDPSRLVNCASGGNDFPAGHIYDLHRYPGPFAPKRREDRASVLGEYGGLGLPLPGHTWQDEKNWGYRSFASKEALADAYLDLLDRLQPMIGRDGLAAAIYTQTTDVEIEVNGLLTYDRKVEKLPVDVLARAHQALWKSGPATTVRPVVPTSELSARRWSYTTEKPADGWEQQNFADAGWSNGEGGFGEPSTPGSKVRTEWRSPDIWARQTFELAEIPAGELRLRVHHDEDAEIYLNGTLIKRVAGYSTSYQSLRLPPEAKAALKVGRTNVLAVHCHQTGGGQYIDVGIDVVAPVK